MRITRIVKVGGIGLGEKVWPWCYLSGDLFGFRAWFMSYLA